MSATLSDVSGFSGPTGDIAAFYGFSAGCRRIFDAYREAGRPVVLLDLGYWSRGSQRLRYDGYHKVTVNSRHPTQYFQRIKHDSGRFLVHHRSIKPWSAGKHILLAGMSEKSAHSEGFEPSEWERAAAEAIRRHTDRPIVYRPKPTWSGSVPISGTTFVPDAAMPAWVMADAHAVVTHHSNMGVDALIAGKPVFTEIGAASVLGTNDLSMIETPLRPDGREQFMADLAYCQWSTSEMTAGLMWRHLLAEGLL